MNSADRAKAWAQSHNLALDDEQAAQVQIEEPAPEPAPPEPTVPAAAEVLAGGKLAAAQLGWLVDPSTVYQLAEDLTAQTHEVEVQTTPFPALVLDGIPHVVDAPAGAFRLVISEEGRPVAVCYTAAQVAAVLTQPAIIADAD